MSRQHEVTVLCPRCDNDITLDVVISGGYTPATRSQPAEYPEYEYHAPSVCTHVPDETEEFDAGPFTPEEVKLLDQRIEEEARDMDEASAFDPAWDGPEDDR